MSDSDGPYAAGLYTFARTLGLCLGVAIGGTALHNFLKVQLREANLDENLANNAEAFILVLNSLSGLNQIRAGSRNTCPSHGLVLGVGAYAVDVRAVMKL